MGQTTTSIGLVLQLIEASNGEPLGFHEYWKDKNGSSCPECKVSRVEEVNIVENLEFFVQQSTTFTDDNTIPACVIKHEPELLLLTNIK